ncbi:ABC transporter permease [Bacillus sp. HMF5848]|uniref:ABC transporter permease n=1 Tax=Bacillus sp. HMF5848 TaxID=2495421 RepID=UPI000F79FF6B|nr:ABC transporter permease [Bacillus sp. HMF5848]RSK26328.1 ABC transporter permease [Bacillus sp. HMF5848]
MMNIQDIWNKRFQQYLQETSRYLRYIFNQHLMLVLLFLIGGGAYAYQQWLTVVSPTFPANFIMALIIAAALTPSAVQTFLKEPDIVFLLPAETKLAPYFKKCISVSIISKGYMLVVAIAVLSPLYVRFHSPTKWQVLALLTIIVILKAWNMFMKWKMMYIADSSLDILDIVVRYLVNFAFIYIALQRANPLYIAVIIIIAAALMFFYMKLTNGKTLKWEKLIHLEEKRMLSFYKIANLFTDVPHLKQTVKRRKWLDPLLKVPFSKEQSYPYLYWRTFARSGDYFSLYIRLTIIAVIFLLGFPTNNWKIFIIPLFLYVTGFQLKVLFHHFKFTIWLRLYPINANHQLTSFKKMLFLLLTTQTVFLSAAMFFIDSWQMALYGLLAGLLSSGALTSFFMKKINN